MKVALSATGVLALAAIAGVGLAAWKLKTSLPAVGDAIGKAANAVNPFNPDNVVATGVNGAVSAATGRPETLGGLLYDWTHADAFSAGNPPAPPVTAIFDQPKYDAMGNPTGY